MTNIQAEAKAILEASKYWRKESQVAKILETYSLIIVKILKGHLKIPWEIAEMVEEIR